MPSTVVTPMQVMTALRNDKVGRGFLDGMNSQCGFCLNTWRTTQAALTLIFFVILSERSESKDLHHLSS
jgi:hypothetical protein